MEIKQKSCLMALSMFSFIIGCEKTRTLTLQGGSAQKSKSTAESSVNEDSESKILLSYLKGDRPLATSCVIQSVSNVTVTAACSCDSLGECTVGVSGLTNYSGPASFSYILKANNVELAAGTVNLIVTAIDDIPVASDITTAAFNEDTASSITLSYTDDEGDKATACTISALSNVTESTPCACDGAGVCTVGIKGASNYFGTASFAYTVTANGAASNSATATISISSVNDAPTDITLSNSTIAEHLVANSAVGSLTAADVDSNTFTYSLVAGTGDTDNASFNISADSLRANSTLIYTTKSSYNIRVQVSDGALTFQKAFTISVLDTPDPVTGIACGLEFCLELRTDRTLWAWGAGYTGQLGDGNFARSSTPIRVGTDATWMRITGGTSHALAIKADGTLWGWGNNSSSQLGTGDTLMRGVPTQIGTATTWKDVAAHQNTSLAIQSDGTLWGWGGNGYYTIGLGDTTIRTTPTQVGTATNWKSLVQGPISVVSLAIKSDDTLWGWGFSWQGNVGTGTSGPNIYVTTPTQIGTAVWKSVSSGNNFNLGVQSDGTLWTWGYPGNGRLGNNSTSGYVTTPTKIGTATDWISVSAGSLSSYAIKGSGGVRALYAWGTNTSGQLGDGTTTDVLTPSQVGTDTSWQTIFSGNSTVMGQKSNGSLWGWGLNYSGELGDGSSIYRATPTQIGSGTSWATACASTLMQVSMASVSSYNVALKTDGTLWSWGQNAQGQLGQGNNTNLSTPTQVGALATWSKISCGTGGHVLAIKSDGTLWAWGHNGSGRLGDGTTAQRTSPVQIGALTTWSKVSAGQGYSAAIKTDGTLWAWGANGSGQLGNGTTTNQTTGPVQIGNDTDWAQVVVSNGAYGQSGVHTLAIKTNGTLWAWGANTYGQLGDGTTTQQLSPVQIGTGTNWANVIIRGKSSFARKTDGTLWSWGDNTQSQLGQGDSVSRSVPTQIGTDNNWTGIAGQLFATKTNGSLWGWGPNDAGILGITSNLSKAPAQILAASSYTVLSSSLGHTVGIKADGTLWTWGSNESGQLGEAPPSPTLAPIQTRAP